MLTEQLLAIPLNETSVVELITGLLFLLIGLPVSVLSIFTICIVWYGILKNLALRRGYGGFYCDLRDLIDWMV